MVDLPKCRSTRWDDADRWADTLAASVRAAGFAPTTIVGLTRGGWVPSRLLADRLGVRRLVSLRMQHWGVTAVPSGKAELTEGLSGPVTGEDVLVVDDITDTGESLEIATATVVAAGARRTESAACLHITHSKYRPTHVGEEIPRGGWVWVVFPWNYWEDLRNLAERAAPEGKDPKGIARVLQERCGWTVPLADVSAVRSGRA